MTTKEPETGVGRQAHGRERYWSIRVLGALLIAMAWSVLIALVCFLAMVLAMSRDLRAPEASHLTAGTSFERIARVIYLWRFRPEWQGNATCSQYDPELSYVPRPGVGHFRTPEFDTTVTETADGVRQQPPDTDRDGDPIVMLGDSFTLGWGVNDDQTFSALLQTRYHHQTVNTGVASYGTARELLRLRRLGLVAGASMLIVQYCDNDDGENLEFLRDPSDFVSPERTTQVWAELAQYRALEPSFGAVLDATMTYLHDRGRVEGWRRTLRELVWEPGKPWGAPRVVRGHRTAAGMATTFLKLWDSFPELAGKPVIVTEMNQNGGATRFVPELQKLVHDRSHFLAVSLTFSRDEYYRFDDHLNASGHASAARQLDAAIRQLRHQLDDATP